MRQNIVFSLLMYFSLGVLHTAVAAKNPVPKNRCMWLNHWKGNDALAYGRAAMREKKTIMHMGHKYSFGSGDLVAITNVCGADSLSSRFQKTVNKHSTATKIVGSMMYSTLGMAAAGGIMCSTHESGCFQPVPEPGNSSTAFRGREYMITIGGGVGAFSGLLYGVAAGTEGMEWKERADRAVLELNSTVETFQKAAQAERKMAKENWATCLEPAKKEKEILARSKACGSFANLMAVADKPRRIGTEGEMKVGNKPVPWLRKMVKNEKDARITEVQSFFDYVKLAHKTGVETCSSVNIRSRTDWMALDEKTNKQLENAKVACERATAILVEWNEALEEQGWADTEAASIVSTANAYVRKAENSSGQLLKTWNVLNERFKFEQKAISCEASSYRASNQAKQSGRAGSKTWSTVKSTCQDALASWTSAYSGKESQRLRKMIATANSSYSRDLAREKKESAEQRKKWAIAACNRQRRAARASASRCGANQIYETKWVYRYDWNRGCDDKYKRGDTRWVQGGSPPRSNGCWHYIGDQCGWIDKACR